jgi:serine/threonine protein kinase
MVDSLPALLQLIRRHRVLAPTQLNDLKTTGLTELDDPRVLTHALVQRGWLTLYQAEQLLEGQGQALAVGPYHLLGLLGEGALGQVFLARHRDGTETVALKVLRPELRNNAQVLEQFWQERTVLASLSHPAFVGAVDDGATDARYYFAMEYVDGIDLGQLLRLAGPLPASQACDCVRQAALGLQYAFEHGLVHRDVKPANLLAAFATGQVRILDIGSARREWADDWALAPRPGGALMGTADYIAPEQILNPHEADVRSDVYSLGCTLYHLLTGRPPFPGGSLARKLLDHQHTPAPSVLAARPDLPEELGEMVARLLCKRPEQRCPMPALVAVALTPFCQRDGTWLELERFRPRGDEETLRADGRGTLLDPLGRVLPHRAPAPGGGAERRTSPRRGGNVVAVLVTDGLAPEEPLRGWIVDRSAGGLGLLLCEALEIGTVVRVRPDRPDVPSRWVSVRVVHCRPERVRWRIGCQFVQPPGWDVLTSFG